MNNKLISILAIAAGLIIILILVVILFFVGNNNNKANLNNSSIPDTSNSNSPANVSRTIPNNGNRNIVGNNNETISSEHDGEGEGTGSTISADPSAYFKITSRDLIKFYNTYQYKNYSNLETVALQSTPELAKKISDYEGSLIANPDTSLSLYAVVDDSSFVLKQVTATTVTTEISLTVYSTVRGQNSQKSIVVEIEFVKQNNEWLLNQINYKNN